MKAVIGAACVAIAATCGWLFQDDHVRLEEVGQAADQYALAHRDSAYTSMTWVVSPSQDYAQMRFFDRVEGGVCLHPSWAELIDLAKDKPSLAHLVPQSRPALLPAPKDWPAGLPVPDMGCVNSSAYISLFPLPLLLNNALMAKAGADPRQAPAKVLVVGLGSGVGIANLAYHFPKADITVVDIDAQVIGIVREHFPLIAWLEQQGRLHLVSRDARQFIRYYDIEKNSPFDLIVLDAYTAGSTIPPHLMTREFYGHCAHALGENGVLMSNIIGSYGRTNPDGTTVGKQHRVLGGAIRSMRVSLHETWNFPIVQAYSIGSFAQTIEDSRNNIVIASKRPVDPHGNAAGWERLRNWVPFPELPTGIYRSGCYALYDKTSGRYVSSSFPADLVDAEAPGLAARFDAEPPSPDAPQHTESKRCLASEVIQDLRRAVRAASGKGFTHANPVGWAEQPGVEVVALLRETDMVRFPRENWRVSITLAKDPEHGGDRLTGPVDPPDGEREPVQGSWTCADAPLFTDQTPNADIWNR